MVVGLIGLPGVGKSLLLSYFAHRFISGKSLNFRGLTLTQHSQGDTVYTNFPVSGSFKLDFDKLGKSDYHDCLMICDEIQLFADSRNFKSFGDDLSYWFTNHRKDHIDFIYATQDFSFVDKRIRAVTDRIYAIDRVAFGLIRVREVLSDLDLQGDLGWSHFYSDVCKLFIPRFLYKYNDTDFHVKSVHRSPVEFVPWVDGSVPYRINLIKKTNPDIIIK